MKTKPHEKYWDTSLFLCFLNQKEEDRRKICEDNLEHAKDGKLIIYTSYFTIVEVIRPKIIRGQVATKLTPEEIKNIQLMFEWRWLKKIQIDEKVANKAVELCRDYSLRPSDAVHAASAIINKLDAIQHWDRDFKKVGELIKVENPFFLTKQMPLLEKPDEALIGPQPKDFVKEEIAVEKKRESIPSKDPHEKDTQGKQEAIALPPKL